jgi:hypothetical protein
MFLVGPQITGSFFNVWGAWNSLKYNLTGDGLLSSIGQISKRIYRRESTYGTRMMFTYPTSSLLQRRLFRPLSASCRY